jgi:hypothetical protein
LIVDDPKKGRRHLYPRPYAALGDIKDLGTDAALRVFKATARWASVPLSAVLCQLLDQRADIGVSDQMRPVQFVRQLLIQYDVAFDRVGTVAVNGLRSI